MCTPARACERPRHRRPRDSTREGRGERSESANREAGEARGAGRSRSGGTRRGSRGAGLEEAVVGRAEATQAPQGRVKRATRSVVRESEALSSSRDAFGVSNDSERLPAPRLGLRRWSPQIGANRRGQQTAEKSRFRAFTRTDEPLHPSRIKRTSRAPALRGAGPRRRSNRSDTHRSRRRSTAGAPRALAPESPTA